MDNSKDNLDTSTSNSSSNSNENTTKQILNCLKDISNSINNVISLIESNQSTDNSICSNLSSAITKTNEILNNNVDLKPKVEATENNDIELSEENKNEDTNININTNIKEKTLIISYSDKKVILPYTINELNEFLKNSSEKYSNFEQIIEDIYTVPLQYYKNSTVARFKEAYKLVKERENGSIKEAIDLGLEVFSNYNLHPSIITACKNINEFDIYLSCLEYNELEDFHFFKVEFIMPPTTENIKNDIFKKIQNLIKKGKDIIQN